MKNRKYVNSQVTLLTLVLLLLSAGCRPQVGIQYRPFTREDIATLEIGLPIVAAHRALGPEDSRYDARFGDDAGEEWTGLVLEFLAGPDPDFETTERPLRNRLVFAVVDQDTLLNHWEVASLEPVPATN